MNVLINWNYETSELEKVEVERFIVFCLEQENAPQESEVSISFVDNDEIQSLNCDYRGIDKPTDVLSFECDGTIVEDGAESCILGDIIIAPDVISLQCGDYGNTFDEEMYLMLCHGVLHLLGYDHIEDDEAEVMEAREQEILNSWYQAEKVSNINQVRGEH